MVEDISRFAFAEGSFGAGELNGQLRIDRRACADIGPEVYCSRFSRNSSVMGKRYVRKAGYGYFSEEPCRTDAHNEGGTALTSPFTQFVWRALFFRRKIMSKELAKTYDPKGIEERLYQKWMDNGYFHAKVNPDKKPFTIVMPPPNVTGQLHMGHALDETMQDILIRFKRMQGYEALWQPGTDHAAIATEVKVTEKLKKEGIDKAEIGREKFLEYAWEWKEEYGGKIINQLKKLGASADWERERFTMDEGCSKAVQEGRREILQCGVQDRR